MLGQPRSHRERLAAGGILLEGGNERRRWWRRQPQKIGQDPLAANRRRGPRRVGSHGQDASLTQQSASYSVVSKRYAPKPAAVHVVDSIVFCEALVEERVIRSQ